MGKIYMTKRAAQIANTLECLPYRRKLTEKNLTKINCRIDEASKILAKKLNRGLQLSYRRVGKEAQLHVKWIGSHSAVEIYSWRVERYIRFGFNAPKILAFQPISMREMLELCDDLLDLPPKFRRKRNPHM